MKCRVLILILISSVASSNSILNPIVQTSLGTVEGHVLKTINNRNINAFEGIPYAKPPVGEYRFKEPFDPEPWIGILKANTVHQCLQYDHYSEGQHKIIGDEDCLYVNIYSPTINENANLDVLFYIHGGAFMFNYGGFFRPEMLLDRDIVFVNINYRLGPLGFLSTEDDVLPGNQGLKDQVKALKWIKSNIKYFGGNPNSITIMGNSAGGASVQLHYLLPQSKDLFNRGISQSGVALNSWVLMENPLERTKEVTNFVGCPTGNSEEIVSCLRTKSSRQIVGTVKYFQPFLYNPFSPFGAVVDAAWSKDPLIPEHPYVLLKRKKVSDLPWIISYVANEGLYPGADFYRDNILKEIDEKWNDILPHILHYNYTVEPKLKDEVSRKIRQFYLGTKSLNMETYFKLIELIGDRLFVADIEKGGRLHNQAMKSLVYSYKFEYRGAYSKSQFRIGSNENIGVSHADDLSYVFKTPMDTLTTETDRQMSELMINMVVSFMKTGKPNIGVDWKPLSKNPTDPWLKLNIKGPGNLILEEKTILGHREFWDSLPIKENDKLYESVKKEEL